MNTNSMNRRSMSLVVFGLLFLWQVTPLFFPRIPFLSNVKGASLDAVKSAYALPAFPFLKLAPMAPVADPVVIVHKSSEFRGVSLHSDARNYLAVFTGKVNCGKAVCSDTRVRLQLETTVNDNIDKKIDVSPDGSYRIEVAFKETPHEHMDYTLTASNDHDQSADVRGRRILMDETVLPVESAMHLD